MRKTIIIATIALFIGLGTTSCVTTRPPHGPHPKHVNHKPPKPPKKKSISTRNRLKGRTATRILALTAVEDSTTRPSLRSKAHYAAKHMAASHTAYNKPLTLT